MFRTRFHPAILLTLLLTFPSTGQAEPTAEAVLELAVPATATVLLDGLDVGDRRSFTFPGLGANETMERTIKVKFPGLADVVERRILLRKGWRVPVTVADPRDRRPELVPQTGHSSVLDGFVLTADGKRAVTWNAGDIIVWDLANGRQIRRITRPSNIGFSAVSIAADGSHLGVILGSSRAEVWSLVTGTRIAEWEVGSLSEKGFDKYINAMTLRGIRFVAGDKALLWGRGVEPLVEWTFTTNKRESRALTLPKSFQIDVVAANGRIALLKSELSLAPLEERLPTVWDLTTDRMVSRLEMKDVPDQWVGWILSADGSRVAAGGMAKPGGAWVWNAATGKRLATIDTPGTHLDGIAFSPDRERLITSSTEGVTTWESDNGRKLKHLRIEKGLELHSLTMLMGKTTPSLVIAPDGEKAVGYRVVTTEMGNVPELVVLDLSAGNLRAIPLGINLYSPTVSFSPDGKRLLVINGGIHQACFSVWDLPAGRRVWEHAEPRKTPKYGGDFASYEGMYGMSVRPSDGTVFMLNQTRASDGSTGIMLALIDAANGAWVSSLPRYRSVINGPAPRGKLSGDGSHVFAWDRSGAAIFTTEKYKRLHTLDLKLDPAVDVVFNYNGSRLLTGTQEGLVKVWDTASGQIIRELKSPLGDWHDPVAVSPDGQFAVTRWTLSPIRNIFNLETGKPIYDLLNDADWKNAAPKGFTPDGLLILVRENSYQNGDGAIGFYDLKAKRIQRVLHPKFEWVSGAVISPNGRLIALPDEGGVVRLGDLATGEVLVDLITFGNGKDWLAVTPLGVFDGPAGARERVLFRTGGLSVVPVDRFFKDYYRSGLLAAVFTGESPGIPPAMASQSPPTLRFASLKTGEMLDKPNLTVEVEAIDTGGGVPNLVLFQNGSRSGTRVKNERVGNRVRQSFEVRLAPGENEFQLRAPAADGDTAYDAEPVTVTVRYDKPVRPPALLLLSVGVTNYERKDLKLKFAARDAEAIEAAFRAKHKPLYREVVSIVLTDADATREKVQAAFAKLKLQAEPSDTLLVFLAGHGVASGQRFYFIPHEFNPSPFIGVQEALQKNALADDVLSEWMCDVPARKRIVIFDACHSGAAIRSSGGRAAFQVSDAIERLNRATGIHTLAGAAAGTEAMEPDALGHGVLTYALLAALGRVNDGPLRDRRMVPVGTDPVVSVLDWFNYAADQVPRLTKKIYGWEQDIQFRSEGRNFALLPVEK